MLAKVLSSAVLGIDAYRVEVEVDIASGLPSFSTVGLPEASVKESRNASSPPSPTPATASPTIASPSTSPRPTSRRKAPASTCRSRSGSWRRPASSRRRGLERYLILGELSLDGRVKPVRGSLPMALAARQSGHPAIIVPWDNGSRGLGRGGHRVLPARTLAEVVGFLRGQQPLPPRRRPTSRPCSTGRATSTSTSPRCAGRSTPSARSRSRPPAGTTC